MKKTTRNFLIMLAVLVVLGGAAAALLLTQPEAEETSSALSSSASSEAEAIVDREPADVASIAVQNAEGSFEIVPEETGTEASASSETESSSSEQTVNFTLKGYEDSAVDTAQVSTSARSILMVNAVKNLGQQENLEQYGLSGGDAVTVTLNYQDGGKDTLVLGTKAGESAGKYLLKDGTVYIASTVSDLLYGSPFAYFDKEVYSVADLTEETVDSEGSSSSTAVADVLYSMRLSGAAFPKPIEIEYSSGKTSGYLVTSPVTAESGSTKFSELVEALKSLTADSVADAGLTQEKLEQYGLAEPDAQIEFDMNGEKHILKASAADADGNRYLTADSKDLVYQVAGSKVEKWAEAKLMDLRMSYIWLPNIMEVSKLALTVEGDQAYAYEVTRVKNEEKSTESNTSYDLTIQNAGGQEILYENYQGFYKKLIALAVLSADETAYGETPVFRVEYSYFSGGDADVLEFFPVEGQDRYAAVLNGQFNGLVRKTDVDSLLTLIPTLDQNQSVE